MISNSPIAPAEERPPAEPPLAEVAGLQPAAAGSAPVPIWLTAPVLRIAIPDSPFAAATADAAGEAVSPAFDAAVETIGFDGPELAAPEPPPDEPPVAAFGVIEWIVLPDPVPEPASAPPLGTAAEPAGPDVIEWVALPELVEEAAPPPAPDPPPPVVEAPPPPPAAKAPPEPVPEIPPRPAARPNATPAAVAPPSRPELRVALRRPRPAPRVARPPRRAEAPEPAAPPFTSVAERLEEVGASVRAHLRQAAEAEAPSRGPVATAAAPRGAAPRPAPSLAPAAVPETRPLAQNRRLYRRVMLTAELEVDGAPCRLVDLSIGGFAAAGTPRLAPNATVPVTLRLTIDGINIGTQFSARIVYSNDARSAGRFVDLTGAQTAFLRYIVTWRGEAIGAAGTTTLLDAITRQPERTLPPHPSTPPQKTGWWSRWFGRIPFLGRRRS